MTVSQLVNRIARELGRPALLEDGRYRVVAFSPQSEVIDEVRRRSILEHRAGPGVHSWLAELGVYRSDEVMHVPRNPALGMMQRLYVPIRTPDGARAHLWLIEEPDRMPPADVARARELAERLAEEWARLHSQRDDESARRAERTRVLILGDRRERHAAADELIASGDVEAASSLRAHLVTVRDRGTLSRDDLEAAERRIRRAAASLAPLTLVTADGVVVVVPDDGGRLHPPVDVVAERLRSAVVRDDGPLREPVVAIGGSAARVADSARSHREAQRALAIATAFGLPGPTVAWDGLGAYRGLQAAASLGVRSEDFEAGLDGLLEERDGDVLLETLEAYLRYGGRLRDVAARLNVHRATVYHRLARVERILGVDLQDGLERLGVHLAVLLHRIERDATR
ncbi:hypothetical protein GE115_17645 [Agromyces sp. CFH 90414]|uniref:PucR family transcriptional regulator n=1 Tax=Agromyces agglutinans TaxID=2662258 RepID=A0A6I2FGH4_9MICO|nr:PucR family transcriptional regulator [Agromyces agglutinans]MRG61686.1 hypothetical protein [Agromyces agglutinans]